MKTMVFTVFFAALISLQGQDSVLFSNSDSLHGKLLSADPEKGILMWKHPDINSPLPFKFDTISEIRFTLATAKINDSKEIEIIAKNGNSVSGRVEIMDKEKLILNTSFAGKIEINKSHIRKIISFLPKTLYKGPGKLEDWTTNKSPRKANVAEDANDEEDIEEGDEEGEVEIENGVMSLYGYQVFSWKDVRLPELSKVEFETTLSFSSLSGLVLYSQKIPSEEENAFVAIFSPYSSGLGKFNNQNWLDGSLGENGGMGVDPTKKRKEWNKITVLSNIKEKSFFLYIDGTLRHQFKDENIDFKPKGTAICFFSLGDYVEPIKIKNITVDEWNGIQPSPGQADEPLANDTIFFLNKDKATGSLAQIKNDVVSFNTEFAEMSVPLERISYIMLKNTEKETLPVTQESPQVFLGDNNQISLKILNISNGRLTGKNEWLGDVSISLDSVSKISLKASDKKNELDLNKDKNEK